MTQSWRTKPLGALKASEITAVLEKLAEESPDDTALETALRRELTRAEREEWMFEDDEEDIGKNAAGAAGKGRLVA